MRIKKSSLQTGAIIAIIFGGVILSLFVSWEPSNETWGYWLFARIWAETGRTVVLFRSPLYTIYLNLFRVFNYPLSVDLEYVVTTFIGSASIYIFALNFFNKIPALIAALAWIPYMQVSEPPTQKLTLALSTFALLLRLKFNKRFHKIVSYAFLIIAYTLRPTFLILLAFFLISDFLGEWLPNIRKRNFRFIKMNLKTDWPLFVVLGLYIYLNLAQSTNAWNNGWFTSTKWFPYSGKQFASLSLYNSAYISQNYLNLKVPDFYFTNKDLFNGATDFISAYKVNPEFINKEIKKYLVESIPIIANMTVIPAINPRLPFVIYLLVVIIILYGVLRRAKNNRFYLAFILGSILMIIVSIVFASPAPRYLFPVIPLAILSANWYFQKLSRLLYIGQNKIFIDAVAILMIIIFANSKPFLQSPSGWTAIVKNAFISVKNTNFRIMETDLEEVSVPQHLRSSQRQIIAEVKKCKGIMSLEHSFFGAFTKIPISNIYDIWEIPPFGNLGSSEYDGLYPERVDCLFNSWKLMNNSGYPTNERVRFLGYIKPYIGKLISIGAKEIEIKDYGKAVILVP